MKFGTLHKYKMPAALTGYLMSAAELPEPPQLPPVKYRRTRSTAGSEVQEWVLPDRLLLTLTDV